MSNIYLLPKTYEKYLYFNDPLSSIDNPLYNKQENQSKFISKVKLHKKIKNQIPFQSTISQSLYS